MGAHGLRSAAGCRPMSAGARVLLMQLSQRTSGKGTAYLSGWLGKASVVAFEAEELDKFGNKQWNVYLSTPEPRPASAVNNGDSTPAASPTLATDAKAEPTARPLRPLGSHRSAVRAGRVQAPIASRASSSGLRRRRARRSIRTASRTWPDECNP